MYVHVHVDCVYTVLYMSPNPEAFLGWYPKPDETYSDHINFVGGTHIHVGSVKFGIRFLKETYSNPEPEKCFQTGCTCISLIPATPITSLADSSCHVIIHHIH